MDKAIDAVKGRPNNIGDKLRMRRHIKNITLREAAQRAEISFGQLSQIERGVSSPSIDVLIKICGALEMPITWLFEDTGRTDKEAKFIVRQASRRKLSFDLLKMEKSMMSPDFCTGIQMIEISIQPSGGLGDEMLSHPRAKCATVIAGTLGMEIEGDVYELEEGDSFALNEMVMHRYWCVGDIPTRIIFAVSPALY